MISQCWRAVSKSPPFSSLKPGPRFTQLELSSLLAEPNALRDRILEQVREQGEIRITDYWKQALTDPLLGYYSQRNVFSKDGDFTTSPEISSLFGEMVATWLAVFLQTGSVGVLDPLSNAVRRPFRLVELGGGRGLLIQDVLRSFRSYGITRGFTLSMVELSEYNRKQQQEAVLEEFRKSKHFFRFDFEKANSLREDFLPEDPDSGLHLQWLSSLEELLKADLEDRRAGRTPPLTIFLMNEFFDALPTNILEFTTQGWREKVLTVSSNPELAFDLVNSSRPLPVKMQPVVDSPQLGDRVQVSPESLLAMQLMAQVVRASGGAILNIDYGGQGPFSDSIRAIKDHKYIPAPYFWQVPGTCDLSAHVAFGPLAQYAERVEGIKAFEVVPQQFFLQAMGIHTRAEVLGKNAPAKKVERMESEVRRLTSPEEMGANYKVQIISLKEYGEIYPHITLASNVF